MGKSVIRLQENEELGSLTGKRCEVNIAHCPYLVVEPVIREILVVFPVQCSSMHNGAECRAANALH